MQYRRLGHTGLKVSVVSLGTWMTFGGRIDDATALDLVTEARRIGINFFDTADVYERGKAEEVLGRALRDIPRHEVVIATKCFFPMGPGVNDRGLSRKHIDESVYNSLRRLGVDYLDLMQCHRFDPDTPIEETVRTFDDLVRQGKILYWGTSMWTAAQLEDAHRIARAMNAVPPVSEQPPYSLLQRAIEREVMPACGRLGIGVIPYSPLAQGVLTGKYERGQPPESRAADGRRNQFMQPYLARESLDRVAKMAGLAREVGLTPAQLALAWVLSRREVSSVIVGATRAEQLIENARAADVTLEPRLVQALDALFAA